MRDRKFKVVFTTGEVEIVYVCGCQREAKILAQARQIEMGNKYEIKSVRELKRD